MGGFGTFQLATKFPDLFARAQPTVGTLIYPREQLASVRWVPFLMWNADKDELVPPALFRPSADKLAALGYRYERDEFVPVPGVGRHSCWRSTTSTPPRRGSSTARASCATRPG